MTLNSLMKVFMTSSGLGCLVTRPNATQPVPVNKKRLAVVKWQEQCPYQLDLETPNISMSLINPARKKS